MKVLRADCAGACYGVQRALDMACEAARDGATAYTLGPLIHNPQVVARLASQGVCPIASVDELPLANAQGQAPTVIIRSHGAAPRVKRMLSARGAAIVDATCPHVARAQKAAEELGSAGMAVVVVGEEGHPEVEALVACARETGAVVTVAGCAADLPADICAPVGVVVQTTQKRDALDQVVCALRERGADPVVKNTICSATTRRQDAARQLAAQVDAMVVVGGRNSSNTTRLAEICAAGCPRSFHIETADELSAAWFDGCATVGVTAGASTPEDCIAQVVAWLEGLEGEGVR